MSEGSNLSHQLLTAVRARCQARSGPTQQAAITIALNPFMLDGQTVDTLIRLDGIALDLSEPRSQAHRSHRFPVNPQVGYIEALALNDGSPCNTYGILNLEVS